MSDAARSRQHPLLSRARLQLMLRHPYFASAVARLSVWVTDEPWCNSMATDGFNIFADVNFLEATPEEELIGVLAHEVVHVIFGHIDRQGTREGALWNIAIDFATNGFLTDLGFKLPSGGLVDQSFRGMTAEDIYSKLFEQQGGSKAISNASRLGNRGEGKGDSKSSGASDLDQHIDPIGLHGAWARGKDNPTAAERRRLRDAWCQELKSKLPGNISGDMAQEIRKAGEPSVNWKQMLHQFSSGLRKDDYRLYPFNKRHIWRELYLPSVGVPGPNHIMVVVDTSGSMNSKMLGSILAEIDSLRSGLQSRLTLIECDVNIKSVNSYEAWELSDVQMDSWKFRGRGGTSFKAPFEWVQSEYDKTLQVPDALIYLTDGYGEFPKNAPSFPVLWVMVGGSKAQPPFGNRLDIPDVS